MSNQQRWLVYSREHNAFWKPNEHGYINTVDGAGRYTHEHAEEIVTGANRYCDRLSPNEVMVLAPEVNAQVTALTTERDALRDTLQRIAIAYPVVAGPNTCPPSPHGCDKCEVYFLLEQAGFIGGESKDV